MKQFYLLSLIGLIVFSGSVSIAEDLDSLFDNTSPYTSNFEYMRTDSSYLSDHFYGQVAAYGSFSNNRELNSQVVRLTYKDTIRNYDFMIEAEAFNTQLKRTFIIEGYDQYDRKYDVTFKNSESRLNMREAYIRINYPKANIALGKQILVWGQMNMLSPVDFILPYKVDSRGIGMTKAENRYPLNMLSVHWHPKSTITLSGHYILESPVSDLLTSATKEDYQYNTFDSSTNTFQNQYESFKKPNQHQVAFRGSYSPNWGTLAVTYFDGVNSFSMPYAKGSVRDSGLGNSFGSPGYYGSNPYYIHTESYELSNTQAVGLEGSKKISQSLVLKSEIVHYSYKESIDMMTSGELHGDERKLAEWLIANNDSKIYFDNTAKVFSLGLEGNYGWGLFEINILAFQLDQQDRRDKLDELERINRTNMPVIPSIHVAKYFGSTNQGLLGLYAGMMGSLRQGVALYYTHIFNDVWRLLISAENVQALSDNTDQPKLEGRDEIAMESYNSSGFSLGVSYSF